MSVNIIIYIEEVLVPTIVNLSTLVFSKDR